MIGGSDDVGEAAGVGVGAHAEVDESRTGDLDGGDAMRAEVEMFDQPLRYFARLGT